MEAPQHRLGPVALLGTAASRNYWHWLTEVIADLWIVQEAGFRLRDIDRFLLPFSGLPWQQDALEQAGVEPRQVLAREGFGSLYSEALIVPTRDRSPRSVPGWLATSIRAQLRYTPTATRTRRRIYVSRGDATYRRVTNDDALSATLQAAGFDVVSLDGLTLQEQQRLFWDAEAVIAPHGAGLTNLLWCAPQTRVAELVPIRYRVPCFAAIADELQLLYRAFLVDGPKSPRRALEDDLTVDRRTMDMALGHVL